ncbi:MAG: MFS transporter [Planctomycetes bacterium]|nr:MFS transporter [Planctomycetota bacterium]
MNQFTETNRSESWKWAVCVVLFLATTLNYMDRLTVSQMAVRLTDEFQLNNTQYGSLDSAFSIAFAVGALVWGWMADRWNSWWIYPLAVFAWSLAGAATGLVPAPGYGGSAWLPSFLTLMSCRFALGFTESGHWPCALKTTQRILPPAQRTLGNGILQSGAAIGSVVTPLVCLALLDATGQWRSAFVLIGSLGLGWVIVWLVLVRPRDLVPRPTPDGDLPVQGFLRHLFAQRRFWVLLAIVICINSCWHFFRVWMPKFLQEFHGYSEREMQYFSASYYVAADLGSLAAGFAALYLVRRGLSVHGSLLFVFCFCAILASLSFSLIFIERGPLLLSVMLLIAFGSLGLFPVYYSLSQELSTRHQGKVTGVLGCACWLAMAPMRYLEGAYIDASKRYDFGLAVAGIMPLAAVLVLVCFWTTAKRSKTGEPGA